MTEIAKYRVERIAVYANAHSSAQEKIATIWEDKDYHIYIQIGNGKMNPFAAYTEKRTIFNFFSNNKPQRWDVIARI